jgi:hypothetical protein
MVPGAIAAPGGRSPSIRSVIQALRSRRHGGESSSRTNDHTYATQQIGKVPELEI